MKMIYEISNKINMNGNWKTSSIFLTVNVLIWSVTALVLGLAVIFALNGTIAGYGLELFCITGYSGVFVGFLGGIYYLYRKNL